MNPFGILYDPLSIARCAERLASGIEYSESELFFSSGTYHAMDHHGSFKSSDKIALLGQMNQLMQRSREFLKHADVAVITPGTAYAWYHQDTMRYVANCHKLDNKNFSRNLLTEKNIIETLQHTVSQLRSLNPNLKVMITLSPVKHLRDGVAENALSKSRLLSAIHQFIDSSAEAPDYFPAFEIMTEELRDHRFYAEDLAHPSDWSLSYIFSRFTESRFDERAQNYILKAGNYLKMLDHKIMSENEEKRKQWALKLTESRDALRSEFPEKPFTFHRD